MPSEKQKNERKSNYMSILQHLRNHGPQSRRDLCAALGLSWGCVSELSSAMLSKKILIESRNMPTGRGRSSSTLHLNRDICFLGVDINLMGLKFCVCNLKGDFVCDGESVLKCGSKSEFIESVTSLVNSVCENNGNIRAVTFAMQGIYNEEKPVWQFPSKNKIAVDFPKDFKGAIKIPFTVEHDPECILYGHMQTPGSNVMLIRLDKGIGAAIYKTNEFVRNERFEPGYFVVNENGDRLHDIFSLNALERTFGTVGAAESDRAALSHYLSKAGAYLGTALGNICNFIKLDEIYLCGDMVRYYDLFADSMHQKYSLAVLPGARADIKIINIGNAAYGAAKIAADSFGGDI